MHKSLLTRWRAGFLAGLAVVLPGVITPMVVNWPFGTISSCTDTLFFRRGPKTRTVGND